MKGRKSTGGFTIIELLVVVVVIGILAAAGLNKYQNFAELARKTTCLAQLATLEHALSMWETHTTLFGESVKTEWGFTARTGRLTNAAPGTPVLLPVNVAPGGLPGGVGAPTNFVNSAFVGTVTRGPLNAIIRDDKVWTCPGAIAKHYMGEIRSVPDTACFANPPANTLEIGSSGRYFALIAGAGQSGTTLDNGGFTAARLTSGPPTPNPQVPQVPFKIVVCGAYGIWGTNGTATSPGTAPYSGGGAGGPVGPDNAPRSRHALRW